MTKNINSISSALSQSTKWINGKNNLYGHLPFDAANYLVLTGKFQFHQSTPWGYVVEEITKETNK